MSPVLPGLDAILQRTPETWRRLRGASLFLTGGTGWFGRWLLESIARANRELALDVRVLVLSRNPAALVARAPHLAEQAGIRFLRGDVADFAFPEERFSHVVHGATTSALETFQGVGALEKFDTLVSGTRHVLDFAARCGAGQVLFTSSGVVYGAPRDGRPLHEDDDCAPDTTQPSSALGHAKRAAEFLCSAYAERHGWSTTIARCFSFVGPFMPLDVHYAIGNFIRQASAREPLVVRGDGAPIRSYLYAADLVTWLFTMLAREGPPAIFNVGSDEEISILDLARTVRDLVHPAGSVEVLGERGHVVGNVNRSRYVPCVRKAREALGLEIWTPLRRAIALTAATLNAA